MMVNAVVNNKTPSRDLFLNGDVCEGSVGQIIHDIIELNSIDDMNEEILKDYERDPIVLRINTYGGYIDDMWALIDCILTSETPVITMAMGKIMSAGVPILLAGDKRIGNKHSLYMIHNMHGGVYGQPEDIKTTYDVMKKGEVMISEFIASRSQFPLEKIRSIYDRKEDYYFDSKEALKYNIIDEVM